MSGFRRLANFSKGSLFRRALPAAIGGLSIGVLAYNQPSQNFLQGQNYLARHFSAFQVMTAEAAAKMKCQDMVIHEDKGHGLFLVLHLGSSASAQACAQALQKLQGHIDRISPKDIRDDDNEVIMGIAFGPDFLKKVYPDAEAKGIEAFPYKERRAGVASMPATGGDILIHAVCSEKGKLFELVQAVMAEMPAKSIKKAEEVYGFVFRNGRDLSGFIDGTENPADEDERIEVAMSKKTGGSYIIAQRWIHDLKKVSAESDKKMEEHIGRTMPDSIEIKPVTKTSHVGRLTHGLSDAEAEEKRIVRHSMPYGKVTEEAGLFFIAYSSTPKTLDWMLDRMAGHSKEDKTTDALFTFTKPVTGSYFYAPSKTELESILKGTKKGFW